MALTRSRRVIRFVDNIIDLIVFIVLIALLLVGVYAVWDNKIIEHGATSAQWKAYKPDIPDTTTFDGLKQINSDVIGWLDIYGTTIDYPVLYSDLPDEYLTKNPMGEFSLSGSIFLDPLCNKHFEDKETIIYGHHMEGDLMFGPIDFFKEQDFFNEHRYGKLTYDDFEYGLDIWCSLTADAYDKSIYRCGIRDVSEEEEFVRHIEEVASIKRDEARPTGEDRIIIMSTCAGETTSGRTLLVAKLIDDIPPNTFIEWPNTGTGVELEKTIFGLVWYLWIPIVLVPIIIIVLFTIWLVGKLRGRREDRRLAGNDSEGDRQISEGAVDDLKERFRSSS